MLTQDQLNEIRGKPTLENVSKLILEVERLQRFVLDYGKTVTEKLDRIDETRVQMEAENTRLVRAKEVILTERDMCLGLIAQLAVVQGIKAGVAPHNVLVVELPRGQVSWQLKDSEAHLLAGLPPYVDPIEVLTLQENYSRVMNPGIG